MSEGQTLPCTRESLAADLRRLGLRPGMVVLVHSSLRSLGQIYRLGGFVLLLGVGFDRCTSFHLAEYRLPGQPEVIRSAAVLEDGRRVWRDFRDIPFDDDPFAELGAAYEATGRVTVGPVGGATARLFAQPPAVDFALEWLASHRAGG